MVMTDDPEKQEGLAKFMAFWLSPKIYGEWLGTSEPVFSFQSLITPKPTESCFRSGVKSVQETASDVS